MKISEIENIFKKADYEYVKYDKNAKLRITEQIGNIRKIILKSNLISEPIGELTELYNLETDTYDKYLVLQLSSVLDKLSKSDLRKIISIANCNSYYVIFVPYISDEFDEELESNKCINQAIFNSAYRFGIAQDFEDINTRCIFDTLNYLKNYSIKRLNASMLISNYTSSLNIMFRYIYACAIDQFINNTTITAESILETYYKETQELNDCNNLCFSLLEPNMDGYNSLINVNTQRLYFYLEEKHPDENYISFKNNIANKTITKSDGLPFKCDKIKFSDKTYSNKIKRLEEIIEGGKQ